jgi:hypothetical protein
VASSGPQLPEISAVAGAAAALAASKKIREKKPAYGVADP